MSETTHTQGVRAVDSLIQSLDTMAFISAFPAEPEAAAPPELRLIEMEFSCSHQGVMRLMAGRRFGTMLAANLTGLEPDSPEAAECANDALKELLNVTCGAAIRLMGETGGQRLHMSLPTNVAVESASSWSSFIARPGVTVLNAEGEIVAFEAIGLDS